MILVGDLENLRSFDSHGHITLSAYVSFDTPQHRDQAYEDFMRQASARLAECSSDPECQKAIREDVEVVGLYLRTNGQRCHAGLAIFSCAAELFWRAFPLSGPVTPLVSVGPRFNLAPLRALHEGHEVHEIQQVVG